MACGTAATVGLLQVRERGPLVWDEAVRVGEGARLAYILHAGDVGAAWDWVHAQTFYPFLLSALHGLLFFVGAGPVTAAWLPALVAYALASVLAGRLATALGTGVTGAWLAAALCWLTPLEARLAAGGFTEPLGGTLLLLVLWLLTRIERSRGAVRGAAPLGLACAAAWFVKYDYGVLTAGTVGLSAIVAFAIRRDRRALARYVLAGAFAVVPVAAWLAVDFGAKRRGTTGFIGQAVPDAERVSDWGYYPQILFGGRDIDLTPWLGVGLAPGIAALFLGGVGWAAFAALRRPEVRPAVILVVLWYALYSGAAWQEPRYIGPILPVLAALAGAAAADGLRRIRRAVPDRVFAALALLIAVLFAWQLAVQAAGEAGLGERAAFLRPNAPAAEALAFAAAAIENERRTVLLLGPANELSPASLRLVWSRRLGRIAPAYVEMVPEATPRNRERALIQTIERFGVGRVVGLDVRPGSRLDTPDFRFRFASQPDYIRLALQLEAQGRLRRVTNRTTDGGRLGVILWDVVEDSAPPASREGRNAA